MARFSELVRMMQRLDDLLSKCTRCGMCQAVCPVFAQSGHEGDVARGKLALLSGLSRNLFAKADITAARLNRCLLCGACERNCSNSVQTLEVFLKARALMAEYGRLPMAKKMLFKRILARPQTFDSLMAWAARHQQLFSKSTLSRLGTSCGRLGPAFFKERHFTPLANPPLHERLPSLSTPGAAGGLRVAFFPGCLLDKVYPQVALAAIQALTHFGLGIFMPQGQGCCGIPALSAGEVETFDELVRHNLALFQTENWDCLVTACATCTFTLKKLWPLMAGRFSEEVGGQIHRLADKTMDISQFLADRLDTASIIQTPTEEPIPVTYHDPCHLNKSLGIIAQPRKLIAANPRVLLKEMACAAQCCGMGGSFGMDHFDLSAAIGAQKRDHILASGCRTVVTGCPACMLQLTDQLSRAGQAITVRHTMEVFAEALVD